MDTSDTVGVDAHDRELPRMNVDVVQSQQAVVGDGVLVVDRVGRVGILADVVVR